MDISDLPAPPKAKADISDLPAPSRASVPVPSPEPKEPPKKDASKKDFLGEVGEVGKAGGIGAAVGTFTPEILTGLGLAAGAFPPTAPAAPFLLAGGQLARGARLGAAVTGGLGAATGSAAGKMVPEPEKVEVDIPGVQLTRKQLAETAGEFAGPGALKGAEMMAKGVPLVGTALRSLEKYVGLGESQFKQAAERQLATLRGKLPATSIESYRRVYDAIAAADEKSKRAALSEIDRATARSKTIIDQYNTQANRVANYDKLEAQRLQQKGVQEAQKVIDDAAALVERKYKVVRKAEAAGAAAEAGSKEAVSAIGDASRSRYDIGSSLQKKVQATDDAQIKALEDAFNADKSARDQLVSQQESQNIFPENTNAFKQTMAFLNDKLVKGRQPAERVKVDVTEQSVRNAYERVRDALVNKRVMMEGTPEELAQQVSAIQSAGGSVQKGTNPQTGEPAFYRVYKTSFDAMDQVRRKLGEAFDGKPPEGFEGLLKDQAKDLYGRIRAIQVEYAGGPGGAQDSLLKNYSEGKELLNALRIPAGRKVIGTDRLNPEYLTQDPSDIPNAFFKSKKGVEDLIQITKDPALVEKSASDYLARKLSGKSVSEINTFLKDNKEWIDLFPGLSARVKNAVSAIGKSESVGPKTKKLAEGLRTEIKTLPIQAEQKAAEMRAAADTGLTQRLQASEKRQQAMRETGKRLGEVPKVEMPTPIVSGKDPVAEIESLITSGQTDRLKQIAPILKSDPTALKMFNEALDISLSRMNPANVVDDFERIIKPALQNTGLITPQKAQELSQRLRVVQMTLEPSAVAQTARWIIKTGISGEAGLQLTD